MSNPVRWCAAPTTPTKPPTVTQRLGELGVSEHQGSEPLTEAANGVADGLRDRVADGVGDGVGDGLRHRLADGLRHRRWDVRAAARFANGARAACCKNCSKTGSITRFCRWTRPGPGASLCAVRGLG